MKETLDSRDLEEELQELLEQKENNEEIDEDRLKALQELKEECLNYGWEYGIIFIYEHYFEDYAEELFNECYAHNIPENLKHYIDYKKFSEDLEQDYTEVAFEGETYLYREA